MFGLFCCSSTATAFEVPAAARSHLNLNRAVLHPACHLCTQAHHIWCTLHATASYAHYKTSLARRLWLHVIQLPLCRCAVVVASAGRCTCLRHLLVTLHKSAAAAGTQRRPAIADSLSLSQLASLLSCVLMEWCALCLAVASYRVVRDRQGHYVDISKAICLQDKAVQHISVTSYRRCLLCTCKHNYAHAGLMQLHQSTCQLQSLQQTKSHCLLSNAHRVCQQLEALLALQLLQPCMLLVACCWWHAACSTEVTDSLIHSHLLLPPRSLLAWE
jgi:hypothetical protein